MDQTADVIIVGAGVQGASLAFHLASRGADVLVVERSTVGSGATGRSSGFVRMHYDLESDARLAWRSFPYFTDWRERVGAGDCGFVNSGFLQLVPPSLTDALRANVAMLQGVGIETRAIEAAEVAAIVPGAVTDDIGAAAWEPLSGYADPAGTAAGFLAAAKARGARPIQGCRVEAVSVQDERVTGVETDRGRFSAPVVVNAAGAWAPVLARTVGIELPIQVWRHDTAFMGLPPGHGTDFPIVLDHALQVYFRPEGREQMLVGLETANELGGSPDRDYVAMPAVDTVSLISRLCQRVPWMEGGTLRTSYGGQDGMTPDQRPIIDAVGPEGFHLLCGFSGTGFKTAPAIGAGLAEVILDGTSSSVDLSPYRLGRFSDGRLLQGEHAYGDLWQ
jgi:sarcosine oxidase subunit beta